MIVLLGFAILAGAGTALSPCVLPVLPALLSAGGVGGQRRPLGVVLGLTVTFTVTIVGIAEVVGGVGLGSDPLRDLAVAVLLAPGLALIVPGLADGLEARMSRLARFGPRTSGDGFASGLLVGAALGFVYTPCAGPILAAVISVSAASGRTVAVAIAYAFGSGVVLLALTLGGRSAVRPRPPRRSRPRAAARARRDHGHHGGRDRDRTGRQLRPVRRPAHPRSQPHRVAGEIARRRKPPARADWPQRQVPGEHHRPRRSRTTPARRSCWPTPAG